jgi:hypothetical protein
MHSFHPRSLFLLFNDIARANFVAHPSLNVVLNELIFHFGMDKGHSFNIDLDQTRFNLVLAIFVWASMLTGKYDKKCNVSQHLWSTCIMAWVEYICPGNEFSRRRTFLQSWLSSPYDLVWFSKFHKTRMSKVLRELSASKAQIESDPVDFMVKCKNGEIPESEFNRVGPAMTMHFALAQVERAKAERKEQEEEKLVAAEKKPREHAVRRTILLSNKAKLWAQMGEDEEFSVEFSDEDEKVDSRAGEGIVEGDEMDVDGHSVPEAVDLTRVPWDSDWMQALLNIDPSIKEVKSYRPESDRKGWMDAVEGFNVLFTTGDALAEDMEKALSLDK